MALGAAGAGEQVRTDGGLIHAACLGHTIQREGDAAKAYREGRLKFHLDGRKLHGGWTLVRMGRQEGKQENWLLIKENDDEARRGEQAREALGVAQKTLAENMGEIEKALAEANRMLADMEATQKAKVEKP